MKIEDIQELATLLTDDAIESVQTQLARQEFSDGQIDQIIGQLPAKLKAFFSASLRVKFSREFRESQDSQDS